ncbi:MAG: carbamoyltransferase HypF [Candidatus Atelocyanobacterium thalassa]
MSQKKRLNIIIKGIVQGVGFRPFIYKLSIKLDLKGIVINSGSGVIVEVEGNKYNLQSFLLKIHEEKPVISKIDIIKVITLKPVGYPTFEIKNSINDKKNVTVPPDLATCQDCLEEISDPNNRRYLYPFTNCTNCGSRYSIILGLPYDRSQTSINKFTMCKFCKEEYKDSLGKRFHSQVNFCPYCGPELKLLNNKGQILSYSLEALRQCINELKAGKIIAIKGLGGFQFITNARNINSVNKLRKYKNRPAKPFALMYSSLEAIRTDCQISLLEKELLISPQAPIVLLKRKTNNSLNCNIAPNNPYLGVMLSSTSLHYLLLKELNFPLIVTSGNINSEPICIEEGEAIQSLGPIADSFLVHDLPIIRPIDDSVVRIIQGRKSFIRCARGYAPISLMMNKQLYSNYKKFINIPNVLAVGSHTKNTVAILKNNQIFVSQHIGELSTLKTFESFKNTINSLKALYQFKPQIIVCDKHPDYVSSHFAKAQKLPLGKVQHHYAHVLSCMLDNQLKPPVLGIAWDGTGYGNDSTIWGGEFILVLNNYYERIAHFHPFKLPGGDKAIKDSKRSALGMLYEISNFKDNLELSFLKEFSKQELSLLQQMLSLNINTFLTTSVGRLFDGVAAILGICYENTFEGQSSMMLEHATISSETEDSYTYTIRETKYPYIVDWKPIIKEIIQDLLSKVPYGEISVKFHNTLAEIIVDIAKISQIKNILLTGGCFQNKYLTERVIFRLEQENLVPFFHKHIPSNDGGIALGQIIAEIIHK